VSGTDVTKTVWKVRGVTLNYTASKLVIFDVIRKMVLNGGPRDVVTLHKTRKLSGNIKAEEEYV
jgi:hypothetical protein